MGRVGLDEGRSTFRVAAPAKDSRCLGVDRRDDGRDERG